MIKHYFQDMGVVDNFFVFPQNNPHYDKYTKHTFLFWGMTARKMLGISVDNVYNSVYNSKF